MGWLLLLLLSLLYLQLLPLRVPMLLLMLLLLVMLVGPQPLLPKNSFGRLHDWLLVSVFTRLLLIYCYWYLSQLLLLLAQNMSATCDSTLWVLIML